MYGQVSNNRISFSAAYGKIAGGVVKFSSAYPDAPGSIVTVGSPKSNSAIVQITPGTKYGNLFLTGYHLTVTATGYSQQYSSAYPSIIISNLSPSTTYTVNAYTVNSYGKSLNYITGTFTTSSAVTIPSSVRSLSGTPTTTSITLSWMAPTNQGGGCRYKIYDRTNSPSTPMYLIGETGSTSFNISGLSSSKAYTYEISAYNEAGESAGFQITTTTTTDRKIRAQGGGYVSNNIIYISNAVCGGAAYGTVTLHAYSPTSFTLPAGTVIQMSYSGSSTKWFQVRGYTLQTSSATSGTFSLTLTSSLYVDTTYAYRLGYVEGYNGANFRLTIDGINQMLI